MITVFRVSNKTMFSTSQLGKPLPHMPRSVAAGGASIDAARFLIVGHSMCRAAKLWRLWKAHPLAGGRWQSGVVGGENNRANKTCVNLNIFDFKINLIYMLFLSGALNWYWLNVRVEIFGSECVIAAVTVRCNIICVQIPAIAPQLGEGTGHESVLWFQGKERPKTPAERCQRTGRLWLKVYIKNFNSLFGDPLLRRL